MHQLIVTHFKTRRVGIPALFRLFLAFFNALANEDHSSRSHLDQIRVDRTDKVSECWQIAQFFLQRPRLRCMQNVRQKCVVCQSASRPRAAQIYFSRSGLFRPGVSCEPPRHRTRHNSLGTEPSIPTTRKDHSAAAIQRHTHPYTDLYTTDTKLLILLKTLRAGGSS